MPKKKKAPQHAKKSRLRQRLEKQFTKENDDARLQAGEAIGRAGSSEALNTMSFDVPEEAGGHAGAYETPSFVSGDTMDFDVPEDAGAYGAQGGYDSGQYEAPYPANDDTMDFDVPEEARARGPQYSYDDDPYETPYAGEDGPMGFDAPGGTGGYGGGGSGRPPRGGRHGREGFFRKYLSGHGLAAALSAAGVVLIGTLGIVAAFKFGLLGTGGLPSSGPDASGGAGTAPAVPESSPAASSSGVPGSTPEGASQSSSAGATATPKPSATPKATATPKKTASPKPTATPKKTATPQPTPTPQKTSAPPAHTHSWVKQSERAATCTAGGTITYK